LHGFLTPEVERKNDNDKNKQTVKSVSNAL